MRFQFNHYRFLSRPQSHRRFSLLHSPTIRLGFQSSTKPRKILEYSHLPPNSPISTSTPTTMIDPITRLRRAIHLNDLPLLKRIIKNHPSVLQSPDPTDDGNTPLHLVARLGFVEMAVCFSPLRFIIESSLVFTSRFLPPCLLSLLFTICHFFHGLFIQKLSWVSKK